MKWPRWFTGELFGTFLLVFFGCGSLCAAVMTGAQVGVFQVTEAVVVNPTLAP